MGDESTRWTIVVDKEMDRSVRMRLAARGMKKGDLSRYVKDAINRQLFAQSWLDFSSSFGDMSEEARIALAQEAVDWSRKG